MAGSLAEATTTTDGTVVDQHKHRQLPAQGHHHPALELPEMRLQQQQQRQAIAQDEGRQQQALQAAVLLGGLMAKQGNAPGPESSSVMPEQQQHPVRGKGARPTVAGGRGVLAWAGSRPLKRGRSRDTGAEASEELDDGDSGDADVGLGEDQPLRAASLLAQLAGISPTGPLQGGQQQGAHSGREGLRQTAMANGGPPSREDDRSGWRRRVRMQHGVADASRAVQLGCAQQRLPSKRLLGHDDLSLGRFAAWNAAWFEELCAGPLVDIQPAVISKRVFKGGMLYNIGTTTGARLLYCGHLMCTGAFPHFWSRRSHGPYRRPTRRRPRRH